MPVPINETRASAALPQHACASGPADALQASCAPRPAEPAIEAVAEPAGAAAKVRELGGPTGPEPTRYGDWERRGRCIDF